jgi:uncharacterized protein (TIGR00299 family) protein
VTRVAYVNCAAGVAGDMLLGALVDAGADPDAVFAALGGLGVDGYALWFERVQRGGVAATRANVVTETENDHDDPHDHEQHEHRPAKAITALLDAAELSDAVRTTAQSVFDALATAEGAVHGIDPAEVEFHEVGALDAIVDVVAIAAALHDLGVERVVASPVAVGHGTTRSAHGALPNPPPAVVRLLASRDAPIVGVDTTMELSTPTGVAVLVALAERFGALPDMTVERVGYGAGTADPAGRPNVVQVVIGTAAEPSVTPAPGRAAVQLEVNVDDVSGEVVGHAIAALLAAGAHDAWAVPIVMKKGRPAYTVAALVDPADVERIAAVLLAETGSLGVRASAVHRWPQRREEVTVDIEGRPVRVKVASGRAKPEFDDCVGVAEATGRPVRDIVRAAESEAIRRSSGR